MRFARPVPCVEPSRSGGGRAPGRVVIASLGALLFTADLTSCAPRSSAPTATPRRDRGGELRLAQPAPASLDPIEAESVYEAIPLNQIFDGLVDVDGGLGITPSLARTWTVSRDGRTYTFHLRDGVRFHDGTPLTSEDVLFTLRRVLSPEHCAHMVACEYLAIVEGAADFTAGRTRELAGVSAVDPLTVQIVLARAYPSFLEVLAMDGLRIVPRAAFGRAGAARFRTAPIGTGPFRLASWDRSGLHLVANPDYFGGAPFLDAVDIRFLGSSEDDEDSTRFRRGEIDALELPAVEAEAFVGDPDVQIMRYPEMGLTFLGLDTTEGPLRDPRVRRAMTHAIDRSHIIPATRFGQRSATGILPPGLTGYLPRADALSFDPALARTLLTEAGYPGGRGLPPIELVITAGNSSSRKLIREIVSELAAVGIAVRVREVPWEELNRRLDARTAPAFLLTWIADLTDPDSFLRTLFRAGGAANFTGFADDEIEHLLDAGAAERDPVVRARTYARAEQRLLSLAPVIPLYHSIGILALRSRVHGLAPGPLGLGNAALERVWIERPVSAG